MALIRYIGRIWPSVPNVLYDAMRHNLPNVINHASQLLLPGKICLIVPQATVFQCPPEPLVVFSAFCVVCDPCVASSQGLECRECDARHLQAEVTGRLQLDRTYCCVSGRGELPAVGWDPHPLVRRNVCGLQRKVE